MSRFFFCNSENHRAPSRMWSVTAILPGDTSARCVFRKGENQRQQRVDADYYQLEMR